MAVRLGAHMSISGGLEKAIDRGEEIGCETIQILTKNNRQWDAPDLTSEQIDTFLERREASDIDPIFVHAVYLINLCSTVEKTQARSYDALVDELQRAGQLELPWVIIHPGSCGNLGEDRGLELIADACRRAIDATADLDVRICLETTAGQGTALGHRFEHLAELYEQIDAEERLAVCLDTCHIFAAGYEIRDYPGYDQTLRDFDRTVGIDRLACLHLNDSKTPFGQRKDRHEHIGQGNIGLEPFSFFLNDPRLQDIPMVIETPVDDDEVEDDSRNLQALRDQLLPEPD